jgi:toxin ParE1/3/4
MADLRLSVAALRDLRHIRDQGLRDHGETASDAYMLGFERLFQLLRAQPHAGQERPEFRQAVRSLSHRPHRILYRIEHSVVIVDRIIHQARDVARALRDDH